MVYPYSNYARTLSSPHLGLGYCKHSLLQQLTSVHASYATAYDNSASIDNLPERHPMSAIDEPSGFVHLSTLV